MKISKKSQQKIKARYDSKIEEFKLKTMDELKELFKTKMSKTDMDALKAAALYLIVKQYQDKKKNETN